MAFEDIVDGLIAESIPKIGQGADNVVLAPRMVVPGHTDHQGFEVFIDLRSTWRLPILYGYRQESAARAKTSCQGIGEPCQILVTVRRCIDCNLLTFQVDDPEIRNTYRCERVFNTPFLLFLYTKMAAKPGPYMVLACLLPNKFTGYDYSSEARQRAGVEGHDHHTSSSHRTVDTQTAPDIPTTPTAAA
jgi:hypothetical protein